MSQSKKMFKSEHLNEKQKSSDFWIQKKVRLRKKERTVDALALKGEEGRDKRRNATGSS